MSGAPFRVGDLGGLGGWTGWLAAAVAGLALLILAAGLRWDPFDLAARRLRAAEARAAVARSDAQARTLEVEGERAQRPRIAAAEAVTAGAAAATAVLSQQARSADDASIVLPPARADRLRAHDRELCRLAPGLDGCAAAAVAADGEYDAVRAAAPARAPDPG